MYREYPITSKLLTLGRDTNQCDITLSGPSISRVHARIESSDNNTYRLRDLHSTNGVYINNQKIDGSSPLHHNDVIGLGSPGSGHLHFLLSPPHHDRRGDILSAQSSWIIGRSPDCDICLPFLPTVSGHHATLTTHNERLFITDESSLNRTWVNARPVQHMQLRSHDTVIIGSTVFQFHLQKNGALQVERHQQEGRTCLSCHGLSCIPGRNKKNSPILQDINLTIRPGEFVGVLGPSGAGKTTLLKALSGRIRPDSGKVLLGEISLYTAPALFRNALAYVPQDDILHPNLTVEASLNYIARLRLPQDLQSEQRKDIVNRVLAILDLDRVKKQQINQLSGGQRKRISIGAELITRPGMIFLDEPSSGLDPGISARLMHHFRSMSRAGTTVIMTTHSLDHLNLLDKIILLAQGRLVFFGTPAEAIPFFKGADKCPVTRTVDIFHLLDKGPSSLSEPEVAQQVQDRKALACHYAEKYKYSSIAAQYIDPGPDTEPDILLTRQPDLPGCKPSPGKTKEKIIGSNSGPFFSLDHWLCLSRRHVQVRLADRKRLLVYAFIPILLAFATMTLTIKGFPDREMAQIRRQTLEMQVRFGGRQLETSLKTMLSPKGLQDARPAWQIINALRYQGPANLPVPMSVLLMATITAIFSGTVSSCLELSSERPIFHRERMGGMKIFDYLASKLPFCLSITALQCLLFTWCCTLHPALAGLSFFPVFLTLVAVAWTSVAMGLCISAIDPTSGRFSIMLAVAAVLPQLILSGGLGPEFYRHMHVPARAASILFPARWGLAMELTAVYSSNPATPITWIPDCIRHVIGFDYGSTVYYHGVSALAAQTICWLLFCAWLLKRRDPI